jgi:hypothetical protein
MDLENEKISLMIEYFGLGEFAAMFGVTKQSARKRKFSHRTKISDEVWEKIQKQSHGLFSKEWYQGEVSTRERVLILDNLLTVKEVQELTALDKIKFGFDPDRQIYIRELTCGSLQAYQHISK